jgi:hypothetical protein
VCTFSALRLCSCKRTQALKHSQGRHLSLDTVSEVLHAFEGGVSGGGGGIRQQVGADADAPSGSTGEGGQETDELEDALSAWVLQLPGLTLSDGGDGGEAKGGRAEAREMGTAGMAGTGRGTSAYLADVERAKTRARDHLK